MCFTLGRNKMRITAAISCVFLGACTAQKYDLEYWGSSTSRYVESPFAQRLSGLVQSIEKGDLSAWDNFARLGEGLDGEYSQTYSVACSELLRRDPTFLLRRYIAGDERTIAVARRGYGWSGHTGRCLLDEIYARRLYIASTNSERRRISDYIEQTATAK